MKLFQQLLVAPAALGLMAPLAVSATELNIQEVSEYGASRVQSQSFSDVHPSDWAFKALVEMTERNGCSAATPTGTISRYEAAALLNECLSQVSQVTEDETILLEEFGPELALLQGRVDVLESRLGALEAGQFSTTTTVASKVAFLLGSADQDKKNSTAAEGDGVTGTYVAQFNVNTSFTGEDLLYARLKTGNNSGSAFDQKSEGLYTSYSMNSTAGEIDVDKIWYQTPLGDSFTAWVGPRIENYYMLASAPSIYKPIMKGFALGGNGTVYGSSTQAGFGLAWTQQKDDPTDGRFAVSAAFTSTEGEDAGASNDKQGFFGEDSETALLTKFEYGTPRWQTSVAVAFKDGGNNASGWVDDYYTTALGQARNADAKETAIGYRVYWRPQESGPVPSISMGIDSSNIENATAGEADKTFGWMVGLNWSDLLIDGNKAGLAFGQRVYATSLKDSTSDDPAAQNFSWEAYYTFNLTDGISLTPTLFGNKEPNTHGDDNNGVLLVTEFKF